MTMTKQNVVVPELSKGGVSVAAAVAATISYPPPRGGGAGGMMIKKKFVTAQLELSGTRFNGWVESMKASSPTHAKAAAALASPSLSLEEYSANWMVCVMYFNFTFSLYLFSFYCFKVMKKQKLNFCLFFFYSVGTHRHFLNLSRSCQHRTESRSSCSWIMMAHFLQSLMIQTQLSCLTP
jgi:hypothetical protein